MKSIANLNNVTPIAAARKNRRKAGYKRLSLNKHDKLDDALKAARNEAERIKRIVARHSDPGDPIVARLDRFWGQYEAIRWDLTLRCNGDYSQKEQALHCARKLPSDA